MDQNVQFSSAFKNSITKVDHDGSGAGDIVGIGAPGAAACITGSGAGAVLDCSRNTQCFTE